jgi:putative membrane protein
MGILIRILLFAAAAYIAARLIPGVQISNAQSALLVAIVLGLLNAFLKPILVALTIPITIITLGLFLLVINILMIYLAAYIVDGFNVQNWIAALLFSIVMAVVGFILDLIF